MNEPKRWLDEPRNVTKVVYGLYTACALLFLADAFYLKHPHFGFEGWFGFYAAFGFIGCVVLVLAAKVLRWVLGRPDDYYDKPPPGDQS